MRPERLELPAYWFEASRSIQLSYGRACNLILSSLYICAKSADELLNGPDTQYFGISGSMKQLRALDKSTLVPVKSIVPDANRCYSSNRFIETVLTRFTMTVKMYA